MKDYFTFGIFYFSFNFLKVRVLENVNVELKYKVVIIFARVLCS